MGTRDEYVASIKSTYVSITTRVALAAILSAIPLTWNPIVAKLIKIFVEPILRWLNSKSADAEEMLVFFKYIDTRVGNQANAFNEAALLNHKAQQSGSKEEKKAAEEKLWKLAKEFLVLTN